MRKEHLEKGWNSADLLVSSETHFIIIKLMRVVERPWQIAEGRKLGEKYFDRPSQKAGKKKSGWCKNWVPWGKRQTLSFVIACSQDNSTAIIFCNVLLKQVPAPPVSFQWKQRLLSHQITSHLNTHIVRISQINLIRILLPGVPPGCNQLHCIWIKLTRCCHSQVTSDCCTL